MQKSPKVISLSSLRQKRPIPVLIVQGLPGAGASDLFEAFAREQPNLHIDVIGGFPDLGSEETCNQCELTNFFIEQVDTALQNIARGSTTDLLWIESPPELDVTRLTEALETIKEIRVHAVITSIDQGRFLSDFSADRSFHERFSDAGELPSRISKTALDQPVLETLIDQIECCDFFHLHGDENAAVQTLLMRLNPRAQIFSAEGLKKLTSLKTPFFEKEKTYRSAAWQIATQKAPRGETTPECFRSRRPFHPVRLNSLIERWPESIIRSNGTVWLASHNQLSLTMSQVGPAEFFFSPEGYWLATLSPLDQQATLQKHPELKLNWDARYGDRMTELAFVSDQPLTIEWIRALEACVLTDFEMRLDWSKFENPFPTFEDAPEDSEHHETEDKETEATTQKSHLHLVNLLPTEKANP